MANESQTAPDHSEVAFIETLKDVHVVTVVERWVPATKGEYAPVMFGSWADGCTPMKLEGRYIDGKRI